MLHAIPPQQANRGFRWRGKMYHLTYKGHIPRAVLLARLASISSIKVLGTSCVHEASDVEVPYDHTHFGWVWARSPDLTGCHIMDVLHDGLTVHPNVESKKSVLWMERVFIQYHAGWKAGADGKLVFIPPVAGPWQEIPPGFEWSEYTITEAQDAADLAAGCAAAGVRPRSVSDVMLLQAHKRPAPFDHNYPRASFKPLTLPPAFVSGQHGTLHIYGGVNLGKTEWASSRFDNPLVINTRDGLRGFRAGVHDGIVLDKMLFNDWTVVDAEALTEFKQNAQIKCRYGVVDIPKGTPKIVVTNTPDAWPHDPYGQLVGRRVSQLEIKSKTF